MNILDVDDVPVLIIGAGISGLGTARELKVLGIPCCILDAEDEPGMTWQKRHPQLRLNTHRRLSQLPGLDMPVNAGDFPHRDRVVDYVRQYAGDLGVPIRHGCRVTRLRKTKHGWHIETNRGSLFARHVVIATGRERTAIIPGWHGRERWGRRLIHASDFGEVEQYRDKHVLVAGAGNSGMDVLNQLVGIETASLTVSIRFGPTIIPKYVAGFPLLRLSPFLSRIPIRLLDPLLTGLGRLIYGDLRRHGLMRHPDGGAKRLLRTGISPAIDNGAIAALKKGRIRIVPEIKRFNDGDIELVDGSLVAPDVVIAATGYTPDLGGVLRGLDLLDARGFPAINGGEQHPSCPGIWFTGMRPSLTGFFHASTVSGRAIARGIAATIHTDKVLPNMIPSGVLEDAQPKPSIRHLMRSELVSAMPRIV